MQSHCPCPLWFLKTLGAPDTPQLSIQSMLEHSRALLLKTKTSSKMLTQKIMI